MRRGGRRWTTSRQGSGGTLACMTQSFFLFVDSVVSLVLQWTWARLLLMRGGTWSVVTSMGCLTSPASLHPSRGGVFLYGCEESTTPSSNGAAELTSDARPEPYSSDEKASAPGADADDCSSVPEKQGVLQVASLLPAHPHLLLPAPHTRALVLLAVFFVGSQGQGAPLCPSSSTRSAMVSRMSKGWTMILRNEKRNARPAASPR